MMPDLQFVRALARIEMLLDQLKIPDHRGNCPADDDTGYGPCKCGVSSQHFVVSQIRDEIKKVMVKTP
jgi:hypothetical protein